MTRIKLPRVLEQNLTLILLVVLLLLCSQVFILSHGWARFGWEALSFLCLLGIYKLSGLKTEDIGLSKKKFKAGAKLGLIAVALIVFFMLAVFFISKGNFFKDSRYDNSITTAIYLALVIVPIKTVLFEELAFRGILPALIIKPFGSRAALLGSSLAFGLWHVSSAPREFGDTVIPWLISIFVVVMVTSVAGAVLYYLRRRSDSLLAPILAHWFINGSAIILAAIQWHA